MTDIGYTERMARQRIAYLDEMERARAEAMQRCWKAYGVLGVDLPGDAEAVDVNHIIAARKEIAAMTNALDDIEVRLPASRSNVRGRDV